MDTTVKDAVWQLLVIVEQLRCTYPKKKFTLDGSLVGDLGETLVEGAYDIELFVSLQKHRDLLQLMALLEPETTVLEHAQPCRTKVL